MCVNCISCNKCNEHFYSFLFQKLEYALKVFNYFFTAVFIVEAVMKVVALGIIKYIKNK